VGWLDSAKLPVNFPNTSEFAGRDRFASACILSQADCLHQCKCECATGVERTLLEWRQRFVLRQVLFDPFQMAAVVAAPGKGARANRRISAERPQPDGGHEQLATVTPQIVLPWPLRSVSWQSVAIKFQPSFPGASHLWVTSVWRVGPLMKPSEPIFAILEPLISLAVISCDSSIALGGFRRNQPCLLNRRTLIVRDPVLLCAHHS
jgi:hypothetical protein